MASEIRFFEGSKVEKTFDISRLDVAEQKLAERSEGLNGAVVERVLGALRGLRKEAA